MSITIHDVAKKLNISIYTVSRALDGYDDVAVQTRQLVIETANKMGYAPNRAARQLRRQKSETIGFILPAISKRFSESFFTEFVSGLGEELSGKNFDLLISNATTDDGERNLYHRWVNGHKVDGFILSRIRKHDWRVNYLSQWDIPFVALGQSHDEINYPCVRIDGAEAYLELIGHIQVQGFSRFAFIGGPGDLINQIDRLKWFKSALKKCGLELDRKNVVLTDMSSTGGYEAAQALLANPVPPDAILAVTDETALGVLHAAHERGLTIGTDLAIAGFDGVQESRHTEPSLTTLDIPVTEIAQQLARMLLEKISGQTPQDQEFVIKPKLLIRASTGG
ncbi:MAG TPA: LacI family DNA-binding transcriptional regulator [Anaerolineales bacterium]|nr:LacI family DNA-binding transcriptional regulator [Anaerolineales bacterium]